MEPVEFTPQEREVLRSLARTMGSPPEEFTPELVEEDGWDEHMRQIVREEIASLAGKALRRSQDVTLTRNAIHNEAEDAANRVAAHFWGEVLAEYGGTTVVDERD